MDLSCCMSEQNIETHQLEAMLADYQRLKNENAAFRRLLVENGIEIPTGPKCGPPPPPHQQLQDAVVGTRAKMKRLPCSEVYFEDGKMSMPCAYVSRAASGVMSRPRFATGRRCVLWMQRFRKKVDQKTRKLLPLTDEILRQHLEGK